MARGGKKAAAAAANVEANPDMVEKKRLKKLAISKQMLSENPSRVRTSALSPSKTVIKHHGKDILRKSQRKNRFLFSFPGLLAPVSGGKIGELKDLGTKNPILYLDFPQGQMKLFGTIVYPENRYLTLQFSRGGKNVVCEDYFDNMIVFSDAWWIGRKDENPEEARLEFPKELNVQEKLECDFKGGAGATSVKKRSSGECEVKHVEQLSPEHEQEENISESQNDSKELVELTPTRRSARAAGKKINFAEASSGDDLTDNGAETSEDEEKSGMDHSTKNSRGQVAERVRAAAESASKSKESSRTKQNSLVQATISTLFKKVDKVVSPARVSQRKTTKSTNKGTSSTGCGSTVSDHVGTSQGEDDIEEFSSSSKDADEASDEDWAA
ncbi:DNA-binding protein RHL1 isoform X3 [Nicotiana tabacum]|uniref:DNA-binding protein RHL1 isoform X3 n=2 Tax=Nicotiana TaxID=4085 RepID=A0A1S4CP96_TOBAC|nr:PREDICTED: DNA-binding protein RHL1 isoform X3 [Nicotiana sylvestris]XP_016503058.1 PREDICTED: DNA-binding protein RHL1-like isoform X3 [Nicotiana tabacum]